MFTVHVPPPRFSALNNLQTCYSGQTSYKTSYSGQTSYKTSTRSHSRQYPSANQQTSVSPTTSIIKNEVLSACKCICLAEGGGQGEPWGEGGGPRSSKIIYTMHTKNHTHDGSAVSVQRRVQNLSNFEQCYHQKHRFGSILLLYCSASICAPFISLKYLCSSPALGARS